MEDGDTYDRWMIFERVVGIRSTFVIAIGRRVEERSLYVLNFSKVKRVQVPIYSYGGFIIVIIGR